MDKMIDLFNSLLATLDKHGGTASGLVIVFSAAWAAWKFFDSRSREEVSREYNNYHQLTDELVRGRGEGEDARKTPMLNGQIAAIYELQYFKKYLPCSLRALKILKESWADNQFLVDEINVAIENIEWKIFIQKILSISFWIIAFETISLLINQVTQDTAHTWYSALIQPSFAPPNFLFPIAWTIIYALLAATGWLLWDVRNKKLLALFSIYMALNWSWSFIFFGAHQLMAGLIWVALLDIMAITLIIKSWNILPRVSYLMIPPTIWTLFAMALNAMYCYLN